jgi:hypothetical protein
MTAPPRLPLPGTLNAGPPEERVGSGETSMHVQVFKSCCELWLMSYDVRQIRDQRILKDVLSCQKEAERIFRRYLSWSNALPLDLVRSDQSCHAVAMVQYGREKRPWRTILLT